MSFFFFCQGVGCFHLVIFFFRVWFVGAVWGLGSSVFWFVGRGGFDAGESRAFLAGSSVGSITTGS